MVVRIKEALVACGYAELDQQAKALGIRSTAWTIIKSKHKCGRLNNKTTQRILANPNTRRQFVWSFSRSSPSDRAVI